MEQRSLASYIPQGCKESDVTERLTQSSGLKNLLLRKIYFKHQPSQLYPSVVVQLLSHVQLFATPWTAAHQASLVAQKAKNLPMDCSPLVSSVYGIFHTRILEWVDVSFSRGSSQPRD